MASITKRAAAWCVMIGAAIAGLRAGSGDRETPRENGPAPKVRAVGAIHPRLSDAGDRIVFSYQGAIWRLPRTGGVMTRLTDGERFDIEPAWSPDGLRIAYIASASFTSGPLRIIRAGDGTREALPMEVVASDRLEFDPNGTRLLGRFQRPGQSAALAWLDLKTGDLTPVPTHGLRPHRYALSKDGRLIAFTTTLDVEGEQSGNDGPEADLWTVPPDGFEPRKIVRFPARIHDLCWGAHDRVLDVATEVGGVHNDLWEIPRDDPERGARRLTFGQADEDRPSTSANGRWLLHTDNRDGPTALVVHDLTTGAENTLEIERMDYARPTGRVALRVLEASDRSPLAARIAIRHEGGKFHAPPGSLYRLNQGELHFYANDRCELDLPEGHYEVKVSRGPEYRVARLNIDVRPDETTNITAALERWCDQPNRGWYSGESHIHANYGYGPWYNSPRTMLLQCAGEDLHVCNFMVANSDGDGVFDREYFRGRPDPLSDEQTILYWNEEFRSTHWGHMTLLNLTYLVEPIFTGFRHTTHPWDMPTNADVADLTHDENGLVNYTHPAQNAQDPYLGAYTAKALPVDVALGKVDSIDVIGSSYEANLPVWYGLLNCGFHIPAAAGTDCFLNRIPSRLPGSDRAYVRVEGEFSYARWVEGLKAGRTFVTNGPMLELTADGHAIGDVVRAVRGSTLRIRGRATSQFPLDRLELIHQGRVIATVQAAGDRLSIDIEHDIPIARTGWVALRTTGPPPPEQSRGPMFAHTGAIYVEVEGEPADANADATTFLAWIDRLASDQRRRNRVPPRSRAYVESQLAKARRVYERLLAQP